MILQKLKQLPSVWKLEVGKNILLTRFTMLENEIVKLQKYVPDYETTWIALISYR